ncbi:major facilitator superfamily domain-containing protein [Diplogelasinospora grovesii]|uniref:Major facilitator superfamily domain-containing protein n=1 Tax=Diplogelasinospora grovesii TaxID=303347 RepID=A0AAN6MX66_9PEZI|nr:major facilitator superfamily domain-containing protein [Diplogelasinospora grovesii]
MTADSEPWHPERAPLLGDSFQDDDPRDFPAADGAELEDIDVKQPRHTSAVRFQARSPGTIITLLSVLLFLIATSGMMIMLPVFRLLEDALCHQFYQLPPDTSIPEKECKVEEVQTQLAYLGGWAAVMNSLVGLVAALPYGVLADRIGRKPAFILSYVGIILGFAWGPLNLYFMQTPNLYLVIVSCLWFLIGGGVPVAMNTLHAMASDLAMNKSTGFLYLSFGAVCGGLTGPVLSGLLMEVYGPWVPILLVFALTPFILGLLCFVPETLQRTRLAPAKTHPQGSSWMHTVWDGLREVMVSVGLVKDGSLVLALVPFVIEPALFAAYSTTLSQHVSTYFGWSLAQTSYRLSPPLSILHLIVILLLPKMSNLLNSLTTFQRDLTLAKMSLSLLIAGALLEGFSRKNLVVFLVGLSVGTLGSGRNPLSRAIATAFVRPEQTSRLYALISMLETGGAVIGGPVLAWCFSTGLAKAGGWVGLPWFYIALLVSLALGALMFVRRPEERPEGRGDGDGDVGCRSEGD